MKLDYSWGSVRHDLLAGVTVAAISVPQSMAYVLIAGIDPRFGLYSAIVITPVASIFGSSSHLINGPTNAISLVVFSALASWILTRGSTLTRPFPAGDDGWHVQVMIALLQARGPDALHLRIGDDRFHGRGRRSWD